MGLFDKFKKKPKLGNVYFGIGYKNTVENDVITSIANLVGKTIGKLSPVVLKDKEQQDEEISKLLRLRPCENITAYDFFYKLGYDLVKTGNFYARINKDKNEKVKSLIPISSENICIMQHQNTCIVSYYDELTRQTEYLPYFDVIHIKNSYTTQKFLATDPARQIESSMQLLNETYQGVKHTIKNNVLLRGYFQATNKMNDEDLKKQTEEFAKRYINPENSGGFAALDNTVEFHELNNKTVSIPTEQVEFFKNNILEYFGINKKILSGTYTIEEWTAFYETTIEPIVINMSQEFTIKLFPNEPAAEVIFDSKRLEYATPSLRMEIGKELFDRGGITLNEYRSMMYLPKLKEGGDERFVSLNYVNTKDQSKYQVGEERKDEKEQAGEDN